MTPAAIRHLKKEDKRLKKIIERVGRMTLKPNHRATPFEALVEAIVYQQLHGKAAATIFKRMRALFSTRAFPKPEDFLKVPLERLRSAGLSEAKARAILDLAQKTKDGTVPTKRAISKLSDEEIVERLCQVRGVGRWTVEMLLIFKLGRPDILPATDFAIRKAFSLMHKRKELPKPQEILNYGKIWQPHRTTAAWYLWRSLDKS
jgi:DNA-3-methyladenine glycosylase II